MLTGTRLLQKLAFDNEILQKECIENVVHLNMLTGTLEASKHYWSHNLLPESYSDTK